jgi:hypothetical protein
MDRRRPVCERLLAIQNAEAAERRVARAVAEWDLMLVKEMGPTLRAAQLLKQLVTEPREA